MIRANVSINFEAADRADAEAKIKSWTLHEGCTLFVNVSEDIPLQETDETGAVKESSPSPAPLEP
jgi:hypothetical protein